ncbi:protease-4 [Roseimicrobium gellanilyticum]|uniref:Protease-4 n=1 Tax=Roseimicrobium gellanilyticum TaxID=748857 RepID=A0A366HQN0_9BACT|nr:signal peptide peptidase SppA [Roseimicrobium gellanilyticum]RBP45404.1 protease-4 [Roseimicrobium gellanilyticum]
MKSKGLGCLITFLVVALVFSVLFNFVGAAALLGIGLEESQFAYVQPKQRFSQVLEQNALNDSKDKIVQIDMEGIIASGSAGQLFSSGGMSVDGVRRALEQATKDGAVRAIVLKVNSPGGEVTASDTLYHAVKQAAKIKPVVVYMDSMAASGGYYLACGATKIVANETTLTGSIGVIIQTLNYSQTFDKVGLQTLTFASGAFKDSLSGSRPMRDDEKAYIQNLVTQMYDKFLGIVSQARGIDTETLKNGIADGRVLTGKEALEKKLVDKVGYIEDAYALAKELSSSANAMVVRYQHTPSFGDILGVLGESQASKGTLKIDVSERLLPRLEAGRMYLLPSHMIP